MPEETDQRDVRQKRHFWEHHLERWQQSGLSQRAYCHEHFLRPHQFYYWRRRILKPENEVSFLPVALPLGRGRHSRAVRILMPNGCIIELEGWDEPAKIERLIAMVAAL